MTDSNEAQIQQLLDKIAMALRDKDLDALKAAYTTDVLSLAVEPPLQHLGIAAKTQNWANVFTFFETVSYEIRDLHLTVGDDVAFGYAFARLSGTLKNGTSAAGMWVRVTYGLQKIDGSWLIAHDQVSVPLDIVSGKGVIDLEP